MKKECHTLKDRGQVYDCLKNTYSDKCNYLFQPGIYPFGTELGVKPQEGEDEVDPKIRDTFSKFDPPVAS
jgi:hypothetical protein